MQKYFDLIDQTFYFPDNDFSLRNHELEYHGVPLMELIREYGTPLKVTYLPKVTSQIQAAKSFFKKAIQNHNYTGDYIYCYCTKSSHFKFIVEETLKNGVQLETSSAYDISIVKRLHQENLISQNQLIVCNGYKPDRYKAAISELINNGFHNCTPVLDNLTELQYYKNHVHKPMQLGIRIAADEEPDFDFYTSRLGIRYKDVLSLYREQIEGNENIRLKMLHFFINSGIKDTQYYWAELHKFIEKYCELKQIAPELSMLDIGGGFPIKNSLAHEYDYAYMADQIVENIKTICDKFGVPVPHIVTEFGNHTVGESGMMLYSVLGQKLQNDKEIWYMIDGSFITHIPDTWAKKQKFVMLAINRWQEEYQKVYLGGLTCDSDDYYNSEYHSMNVFLPKLSKQETQYIGFFHTGAYQETLGGYGGIQHCLIPSAKHVIVQKDEAGNHQYTLFRDQQTDAEMLSILGY